MLYTILMLTMVRDLGESTSQLLQLAHRPPIMNPVGPGNIFIIVIGPVVPSLPLPLKVKRPNYRF